MNDLSRNDADINGTSLYLEHIAITPKQMMTLTTHTCIRSCTSLRAYLAFAWRMRSLRKHSEGGTRFETATLIGLIAGEWYPMNNEDSILLPVLTGGLAYRGCYSYGGPSSKPRPYQSPALPIASSPDFSVTFCYSLTFNINSKSKGVSFQLNCIAYMHFRRLYYARFPSMQ